MNQPTLNRELVRGQLATSLKLLLDSVAHLDDHQARAIPATPAWSVADCLAHLAAWEELALRALGDWHGDRDWVPASARDDHDAFNQTAVMARRTARLAELLEALLSAQQAFLAALDQASDEQLAALAEAPWGGEMPLLRMIAGIAHHNAGHARDLAAILGRHPA